LHSAFERLGYLTNSGTSRHQLKLTINVLTLSEWSMVVAFLLQDG
jgi:hypothetical protein